MEGLTGGLEQTDTLGVRHVDLLQTTRERGFSWRRRQVPVSGNRIATADGASTLRSHEFTESWAAQVYTPASTDDKDRAGGWGDNHLQDGVAVDIHAADARVAAVIRQSVVVARALSCIGNVVPIAAIPVLERA